LFNSLGPANYRERGQGHTNEDQGVENCFVISVAKTLLIRKKLSASLCKKKQRLSKTHTGKFRRQACGTIRL